MTNCVVEQSSGFGDYPPVLDTDEILAGLEARGVRNIDIARALNLPDSRVPEIRQKKRALKLDEAVKLVRVFGLEQAQAATPLPDAVVRLIVMHLVDKLAARPSDRQMETLIADVRAFASFVANPKVRSSIEAAEGFFEALRLRHSESVSAGPPQSDPDLRH